MHVAACLQPKRASRLVVIHFQLAPLFFPPFLLPFSSLLLYILDRWLAKADTLQAATLGFLTFLFAFSLIPLIFFFLIGERLFFLALFSPTHVDT